MAAVRFDECGGSDFAFFKRCTSEHDAGPTYAWYYEHRSRRLMRYPRLVQHLLHALDALYVAGKFAEARRFPMRGINVVHAVKELFFRNFR